MQTVELALLGHQDSWGKISRIFHALRAPALGDVELETLREIVGWIPPRTVSRTTFAAVPSGRTVNGIYVETFITPDHLSAPTALKLAKVRDAIACAEREGARVAALGGFTSIIIEAHGAPAQVGSLALTTGNTLTAAFITEGVEKAARLLGIAIADATIAVIGSTGDIGSACVEYFAPRCRDLQLVARNVARLRAQRDRLRVSRVHAEVSDTIAACASADIVICTASLAMPTLELSALGPDVLVCDAGYPDNLRAPLANAKPGQRVFHGGMGLATGGWRSDSPVLDSFYRFPAPYVSHGCLLEAVVLAFEERYESFSWGRGNITTRAMAEIRGMAHRHGFTLAPLFDREGIWPEEHAVLVPCG